jgi:hypothetical protein
LSSDDTIKYIYTNSQHNNPLGRVVPVESTYEHEDERLNYDKGKYREMILDAAETVLGYFGFDRTVYGNKTYLPGKVINYLLNETKPIAYDMKSCYFYSYIRLCSI